MARCFDLRDSSPANLHAGSIHAVRNDLPGEFRFDKSGLAVAPDAAAPVPGYTATVFRVPGKHRWINGSRAL